jgi:uncharacterized caspase-like protein
MRPTSPTLLLKSCHKTYIEFDKIFPQFLYKRENNKIRWGWRMKMAGVYRVVVLVFISFIMIEPASAAKRVALVIGNAAYRHAPPLANPGNDSEDIAKTLGQLGFEVTRKQDLVKSDMDRVLSDFAASLNGAEMALFFYAGHGLQVSGQNYLIPVDASLSSAAALDFEAVRLDVVQRNMENETPTNVLILDACRDNPLARNLARSMGTRAAAIGKGLAAQESGAGTLISYSTQPGNVALDGTGRTSPFAAALLKHLPGEGRGLTATLINVRNDVMAATAKRQVPWEHSALTNELVLANAGGARAAEPQATAPEQTVTGKVERERDAGQKTAAAPKDASPSAPGVVFSDSFDGKALSSRWRVLNENPELYGIENGILTLIAAKDKTPFKPGDMRPFGPDGMTNVFTLGDDVPLDGEWDMSVRFKPNFPTRRDRLTLGLLNNETAPVYVNLFTNGFGCTYFTLSLNRDGTQVDKYEADIWLTKDCSTKEGNLSPEDYAKRNSSLQEQGGTLTLSKRGSAYRATFSSPVLEKPIVTESFRVLRATGRPAFAVSQWGDVSGEASTDVDEFTITRLK